MSVAREMPAPAKLLAAACLAVVGADAAQPNADSATNLKCSAHFVKPFVDFEFKFVTGVVFAIKSKQFWDRKVSSKFEMIVEPIAGTPGTPARLADRMQTSEVVPQGFKGELTASAAFALGPGKYRVTWKLTDDTGRTCSGIREMKAALSRGQRNVEIALAPGKIEDPSIYAFRNEPPVDRPYLRMTRRLKVLVSLDVIGRRRRPVRPSMARLLPHFAALRQLVRTPHYNEFSLSVFSFEDQGVVIRQDYEPTIDFKNLSTVVDMLQPDTVDIEQLARGSEKRFFERMLIDELLGGERPDGVVFIGEDHHFGQRVSDHAVIRLRTLGVPFVFLDTSRFEWHGVLGNVVRAMSGKEFKLRHPADLARALDQFESLSLYSRAQ